MQTPWCHYDKQGNRHIQHLPVSLCLFVSVFVVRALNVRATLLTNSEVHNIILLITGTELHSRFLELIHLATLKLYTHQTTPAFQVMLMLTFGNQWHNGQSKWNGRALWNFCIVFQWPQRIIHQALLLLPGSREENSLVGNFSFRSATLGPEVGRCLVHLPAHPLWTPYHRRFSLPSPNAVLKAYLYLLRSTKKSVSASGLPKELTSLPSHLENEALNEEGKYSPWSIVPIPGYPWKGWEGGNDLRSQEDIIRNMRNGIPYHWILRFRSEYGITHLLKLWLQSWVIWSF